MAWSSICLWQPDLVNRESGREEIKKSTSKDLPSKQKQTQRCVLCYFLRWDEASSEGSYWWPISSGSNLVTHQTVFSQTTKWLHYFMGYLLINTLGARPLLPTWSLPLFYMLPKKGGRMEDMGKLKTFACQFFFDLKFLSLKNQGEKKRLKFWFDIFNFSSAATQNIKADISWVPGDVLIYAVQCLSQDLSAS